ncbi:bifunctional 2-polyprenyl-6-hydroxyphenol methylase/3-demethylubiquinol 3-O-methyltransferase UbiG [Actinoplanes sp. TFC3]|uniref:class I SAM-dependent methyltransferase n=1 Tax=Actinoplanes sp. TFC3 TaxID=1710355 RepID=UPI000836933A|nr:class I SAM-dependent methyltransferase [Actinoplanes sp. TFC3]
MDASDTSTTPSDNLWLRKIAENPGHSQWYIDRFRKLAADGADLGGEARLIDTLVPRGARILDAGCGTGRVGGLLLDAGHDVVGVDLDAALIEEARTQHPAGTWLAGDLSEVDLTDEPDEAGAAGKAFDAVVCAGNVMTFAAPASRVEILRRLGLHLAPGGRAVIGFGAGRGYPFDEFLVDAEAAGLAPDLLLSSWDLRPFQPSADFIVALLTPEVR